MELMGRVSLETDSDEDELFNDERGGHATNNNNDDARDGNEEEEEEAFVLPPPFRGKQQLRAMLKRQWLFKVTSDNNLPASSIPHLYFRTSYIVLTRGSQLT